MEALQVIEAVSGLLTIIASLITIYDFYANTRDRKNHSRRPHRCSSLEISVFIQRKKYNQCSRTDCTRDED